MKTNKEKKVRSEKMEKGIRIAKRILFLTMIITIFLLSEKIANNIIYYLEQFINLGVATISKIVNTILVTVISYLYFKK